MVVYLDRVFLLNLLVDYLLLLAAAQLSAECSAVCGCCCVPPGEGSTRR